jgi:hypothetical protein
MEVKLELFLEHDISRSRCCVNDFRVAGFARRKEYAQVQGVLHDTDELRVEVAIVLLKRRGWLFGKYVRASCTRCMEACEGDICTGLARPDIVLFLPMDLMHLLLC